MVWDVMIATAFVVVSVAVLACFSVKHVLTWLKKPRWRFLPFPGSMILSRHRFREIVRPYSYAGRNLDHLAARRRVGSLKWSALLRHIGSNHKEEALIISGSNYHSDSFIRLVHTKSVASLLLVRSTVINQS